jgi:predicted transcriptional regulator
MSDDKPLRVGSAIRAVATELLKTPNGLTVYELVHLTGLPNGTVTHAARRLERCSGFIDRIKEPAQTGGDRYRYRLTDMGRTYVTQSLKRRAGA